MGISNVLGSDAGVSRPLQGSNVGVSQPLLRIDIVNPFEYHILRSDVCGSRPLVVSDFGGFWPLLGNDVGESNHYSVGMLMCLGHYYESTLMGPDHILGSDVMCVPAISWK